MKKKTNLQIKILLPILTVLLISNVLSFFVVSRSSRRSLVTQMKNELTAITQSVVEAVVAKNNAEIDALEKISRVPQIESTEVSLYDKQQLISYIHERCKDAYFEMIIVGTDGKGYAYGATELTDYSYRPYVNEALKGNYTAYKPYNDEQLGGRIQGYSVPVFDYDNNIIGAIFCTISPALSSICSSFDPSENACIIAIDRETNSFIGNTGLREGQEDFGPTNFVTLYKTEGSGEDLFYQSTKALVLSGEQGVEQGDFLGVNMIMSYAPVPDTTWSVWVAAPYGDYEGQVKNLQQDLFMALLVSMVAIGLLGIIIVSAMVKPLKNITVAVEDLSSGNADLTKRIEVKSSDEVGTVAEGVNQFTEKLQGIISQLKDSKDELGLAGGELDAISEDTTNSIAQILGNITDVNRQILSQSDSVSETAGAVNQIASNIESLERMIEKQTTGVSEASAAVEEMIGNIGSVNSSVEKMATSFVELEARAQNGVSKQVDVNDKIHQIEDQSETLQEANSAIAAIAEQTNLLAMNAAIEAAHAGEAGKGFSVVADEIRKLSETSSEQSKTIGEQLNKIQELIGDVVDASAESSDAFQTVANKIKETDELVRQIKSAMAEQQEGSKQIGASLHDMNDSTSEVRLASREMSEGNQSLLEEVRQLQDATGVMKNSVQNMQDSARKVSDTEAALSDIVRKMQNSIQQINEEIDQFKV